MLNVERTDAYTLFSTEFTRGRKCKNRFSV